MVQQTILSSNELFRKMILYHAAKVRVQSRVPSLRTAEQQAGGGNIPFTVVCHKKPWGTCLSHWPEVTTYSDNKLTCH